MLDSASKKYSLFDSYLSGNVEVRLAHHALGFLVRPMEHAKLRSNGPCFLGMVCFVLVVYMRLQGAL